MKKSALISLSLLSLLLCVVVIAEVKYLYSGVGNDDSKVAVAVDDAPEISSPKLSVAETKPEPEPVRAEMDNSKTEEKKEEVEPKNRSFKVKNCGTGKINTLRQLADNNLQLVDEKGKSLWTVKLPAPIVDGVSQVDFYNNGKIQFLFAVGDKLHLMDRLGREVSSFPKQLPFNVTDGPTQCKKNGKSYWMLESRTEKSRIYVDFSSKAMKILKELPK